MKTKKMLAKLFGFRYYSKQDIIEKLNNLD